VTELERIELDLRRIIAQLQSVNDQAELSKIADRLVEASRGAERAKQKGD
jgi:hypothetical protein